MYNYLDTSKSIMISAPAGSGKTQKLAGRYISLLRSGVEVERILAVTFTDKAAAEMKQRILDILSNEDERLFKKILARMPLMRVMTIHAFCGTLLRRFSFEASIDPNYKVEDAVDSSMNWEEALFQVLMNAGKGNKGYDLLINTLSEKGFRGLDSLRQTIDYLYQKNPFSLEAAVSPFAEEAPKDLMGELASWSGAAHVIEGYEQYFLNSSEQENESFENLFLTGSKQPRKRPPALLKQIPSFQEWATGMYTVWKYRKKASHTKRALRVQEIFRTCLETYTKKKNGQGILDFSDLEYLTYKMLTDNPEWPNILYAFDEKTDHILVDEFQDTNSFQWDIVNSLTEEWRSGMGAKRSDGIRPTLFFVGDEKQSIYYFRGANVEIFSRARDRMSQWLNKEFFYEEVKENYRSRPAIIHFTNHVFSRIMNARKESPSWMTQYSEFSAVREGDPGMVELIMLDQEQENRIEEKKHEADIVARKIHSMVHTLHITGRDEQQPRPCTYEDIAILLRKRTHLRIYEEALRNWGIPFVAVKGIGFYQEAEVAVLRSLIYFLSNPGDDYSLYVLLKSPLFRVDDSLILNIMHTGNAGFFQKLRNASTGLFPEMHPIAQGLQKWLDRVSLMPVAELIEEVLIDTEAWQHFHEPQRHANIKKFLRIIEDLEAQGKTIIKIRDYLERTENRSDEPKANVNTEGMNAVKIMTIHASKGLEFPVVFLPGLEEPFHHAAGENLIYEHEGMFFYTSEPEPAIRKEDEAFLLHSAREEEEQKRLLYVAVTRAEEALILSGNSVCRPNSFMAILKNTLQVEQQEKGYASSAHIPGLSIIRDSDIALLPEKHKGKPFYREHLKPLDVVPITLPEQAPWKGVTESADIRKRHGQDWLVLGDIIHRLFEGVSKGTVSDEALGNRAEQLLDSHGFSPDEIAQKRALIEDQILTLKDNGIWKNIILPRKHAYTELPFVYNASDCVYSGRIDRVIKDAQGYTIYDYKTFPVQEKDIPLYLKGYISQLGIYKKAVMNLFDTQKVKTFIIFTHVGEIREI